MGFLRVALWSIPCFAAVTQGIEHIRRMHAEQGAVNAILSRVSTPALPHTVLSTNADSVGIGSEWRRVNVQGEWLHSLSQIVHKKSSASGDASWLLTPMRLADGHVVLVNRGAVRPTTADANNQQMPPVGTVSGVLRSMESEPQIRVAMTPLLSDPKMNISARSLFVEAVQFEPRAAGADERTTVGPRPRTLDDIEASIRTNTPNGHLFFTLGWWVIGSVFLVTAIVNIRRSSSAAAPPFVESLLRRARASS